MMKPKTFDLMSARLTATPFCVVSEKTNKFGSKTFYTGCIRGAAEIWKERGGVVWQIVRKTGKWRRVSKSRVINAFIRVIPLDPDGNEIQNDGLLAAYQVVEENEKVVVIMLDHGTKNLGFHGEMSVAPKLRGTQLFLPKMHSLLIRNLPFQHFVTATCNCGHTSIVTFANTDDPDFWRKGVVSCRQTEVDKTD